MLGTAEMSIKSIGKIARKKEECRPSEIMKYYRYNYAANMPWKVVKLTLILKDDKIWVLSMLRECKYVYNWAAKVMESGLTWN